MVYLFGILFARNAIFRPFLMMEGVEGGGTCFLGESGVSYARESVLVTFKAIHR